MANCVSTSIKITGGTERIFEATLHGKLHGDGTFHYIALGRSGQEQIIENAWDLLVHPIEFPVDKTCQITFPGMIIRSDGDNGLHIDMISEVDGSKVGSQHIIRQRIIKDEVISLFPAMLEVTREVVDHRGNAKKIQVVFKASDYPI